MPTCPFCGEYFLDDNKLTAHINSEHPERVFTPEDAREMIEKAQAMARAAQEGTLQGLMVSLASHLTHLAVEKGIPKEQVWATYRYFFEKMYYLLFRLFMEQIKGGG